MSNAPKSTKLAALVTCSMLALSTVFVSGCATTTYGQSFVRDEAAPNQYKFKIYLSALTSGDKADRDAKAEIDKFGASNKLMGGTIVNRRHNIFPEYYEYTVKYAGR
jgi:hypothetical protein